MVCCLQDFELLLYNFLIRIIFVLFIYILHFLSGTYQVSSSDGGSQLGALKTNIMTITNNNVKVPLVLPAEVVSSNASNSSSSSSSSGSSSSIKPVVTAALVAPPITLTAVTPSILKSQPFSQVRYHRHREGGPTLVISVNVFVQN